MSGATGQDTNQRFASISTVAISSGTITVRDCSIDSLIATVISSAFISTIQVEAATIYTQQGFVEYSHITNLSAAALHLKDSGNPSGEYKKITLLNNQLGINNTPVLTNVVMLSNLASTVAGLGTSQYVSSLSLQSTVAGLPRSGYVKDTDVTSSIAGLGTLQYVSSLSLQSTVAGLPRSGYVKDTDVTSSIAGLGTLQYVSSLSLQSTVAGLPRSGYVKDTDVTSSIAGLGTSQYVSSLSLQSTVAGLQRSGYLKDTDLTSSIGGLGQLTYVSSLSLQSTVAGLPKSGFVKSTDLTSSIVGLGTSQYVSSLSLQSTVAGLPRSGYVKDTDLTSSIAGLGTSQYVSSLSLQSTVAGLPRSGYVKDTDLTSSILGLGTSQAGIISSSNLTSSIGGLGQLTYVSSLSLQSTVAGLSKSGYIMKGDLTSSIVGLGSSQYVSSLSLQSTVAGLPQSGFIVKGDMASTVFGLKDSGYVNNSNLQSTVAGLGQSRYVSTGNMQSTVTGLGSQGYVSSFTLQSSIAGLGSLGYLSSIDIQPFVQNLVTAEFTTTSGLRSTVGGLGRIYLSSLYNPQIQTSSVLTSTVTAVSMTATNLTISNLAATNTVNIQLMNTAVIYNSSITASTVNVNGTMQSRRINISTSYTNVTTVATAFYDMPASFNSPNGMASDAFGNIYIADTLNQRIRKISPSGHVTNLAGDGVQGFQDGTGAAARFNHPSDIAIGPSGNIYVADTLNNMIRMITSAGVVTTFAGYTAANGSEDGITTYRGPGNNLPIARFNQPSGIFLDANENIYVTDSGNNKLRKVSQGFVTTLTGASAVLSSAQSIIMNNPKSLAVDLEGNIIVADTDNHKIIMVTPDGYSQTIAGSGVAGSADGIGTAASFYRPHKILLDGTGNIYVADAGNNKIRKITAGRVVTTVAGIGATGYVEGDGIQARFSNPKGLFLTSSGDLFVSDSENNNIRKISLLAGLSIEGNATFTGGYVGIGKNNPAYTLDVSGNTNISGKLYANAIYNSSMIVSSLTIGTLNVDKNITVSSLYTSSIYNEKNMYASSITTSSIQVARSLTVQSNLIVPIIYNSSLFTSTLQAQNITLGNNLIDASNIYTTFTHTSVLNTSTINSSTIRITDTAIIQSNLYSPNIYTNVIQSSTMSLSTIRLANRIFITGGDSISQGRIGVNTTSPQFNIDVIGDINTTNLFAVNTTISSRLHAPVMFNSSLQTSSILASTISASNISTSNLSASNITTSNVYAISTTLASSAYVPFIYNSSLQTSSIVASTLAASNITMSNLYGISTTLASSAYIPFIYNSSIQTSSIVASTLSASNITMSNMYGISTTLARTAYIPHIYNSSLQTSSIMTSSLTVNGEANTRSIVAGSGDTASIDGIGQSAKLNLPAGITKDSFGNLYVTDSGANKIRKISQGLPNLPGNIDSTSIVTTIAGSGVSGNTDGSGNSVRFNNPYGIAVAPNGNVYIADCANNTIRMLDTSGNVTTVAGQIASGYVDASGTNARFNTPYDIAVDATGMVYVADTGNNCIRKIDASGNVTTFAGKNSPGYNDGPAEAALFNNPYGITITAAGVMYVADTLNKRIRAIQQGPFNAGMIVTTVAGNSISDSIDGIGNQASFVSPYSLDTDIYGNLFISDTSRKVIRKLTIADSNVTTLAQGFSNPCGLVTFGRDVYIADMGDNRVYKIYTDSSTGIYGNMNFKNGNLGLAVEIPGYKLDVNGTANISGNLYAPAIYNKNLFTSTIITSTLTAQTFTASSSSANTLWVAVGTGIQTSADGMNWAPANTVSLNGGSAYSVAYNGHDMWVATTHLVGGTCIQYSKDGTNWLPCLTGGDLDGDFRLGGYGVAWQESGKRWVAIGDYMQTSVDGMNWLPIVSGGFTQGNAVACSQSLWVAVGWGSSVASSIQVSSDGLNWTSAATGGFFGGGKAVAWNGVMWVAVGAKSTVYSSIQYSYDGSNWFNSESGDFSQCGNAVAWNGAMWVAVGKGASSLDNMKYSSNGIHWFSSAQAANTSQVNGVSWAQGKWIAVGDGSGNVGNIQVSADGISWQAITENASQKPYYGVANNYSRVPDFSSENLQLYLQGHPNYSLSTNQILATSSSLVINNTLLVGKDTHRVGINTSSPEADLDVKGDVNVCGTIHSEATTDKHLWIAVTTSDILHSADGLNWISNSTGGFSVCGNAVAWNGSMWVAVGKGATSADTIKYSLNGFEWINATNGFSTEGKGVAWNGSMWVAVGDGANSVKYSINGIQWVNSPQASLLAGNGCAVAWNGAMWVAVGSGYAIRSADGKTWATSSTGGFSTNGCGLAWNGIMFVAVGVDASANIQFSYDGIGWSPVLTGAFSVSANAVAWNGSMWVAVGKDTDSASSIKYSYDGLNWLNSQSGGFTERGNTVAWDGTSERWLVGGTNTNGTGSIKSSIDGINWNTLLPSSPGAINGICYSQIQTPDYSSKLLNLFLQGQPNFLTSTNQILATPSTIVVNNTLFIDRTTNCVGVNKIPSLTWDLDVNANIRTSNLYGISTTLESTAYIPYIYNSSMFTSSIMTSTLTGPQLFISAIMTSTVTAPQLFISAIMTSTVTAPQLFISSIMTSTVTAPQLFISAIMTSTVTAPQLFISAIMTSTVTAPQLFISSIMTSTVTAPQLFISSIMTSTVTAPQLFISSIMTSTVTAPQQFISAIMTSTVTAPQLFISAIMTSTVTAPQLFISSIMTSTVTAPELFISAIMTSTVTAPQLFISSIMTSTVTAPQQFISAIMTSTVTAPQLFISAIMTSTVTAPQLFISSIMTSTVTAPQLFISAIMTSTVTAPQLYISAIMTSTVTAPQLFISAIMTSTVTASNITMSNLYGISTTLASTAYIPFIYNSSLQTSTIMASTITVGGTLPANYNTVTTLNGNTTSGFQDGPLATTAQFNAAIGIARDSAGNIYVADTNNSRIRKIDTAGNVTTLAGGSRGNQDGLGTSAQFYYPNDLAVDSAGNVYLIDNTIIIRKIDINGNVTTLAGNGGFGFQDGPVASAKFSFLYGIAVDSTGNVYVSDYYNNRIRKIDTAGNVTTVAGGTFGINDGQGTAAQFMYPVGMAIDFYNNLYVLQSHYVFTRIRKIDTAYNVTTLAGSVFGFQDGPGSSAKFSFSSYSKITIDSFGNLYVTDTDNNRIRKITPSGYVTTYAGTGAFSISDGSALDTASFQIPCGITTDSLGNIIVLDYNRIRKISKGILPVNVFIQNGTLYSPYIYNSSLQTSSILTSTVTAPQLFISAIMTSTVTAPQMFVSSIMTSTVTAPQLFVSSIMTSTVTAPQLFISAIMTSTVTAPQLFISSIMTSTVTAPQLFISAIMTSTVTAPQMFVSSIMTSTLTSKNIITLGITDSRWMTEYYIPPTTDTYLSVLSSNGYMDNLRTMIEVGSSSTGLGNHGSVYKYLFGFSNTGTTNGGNLIIQTIASSTSNYEIAGASNTRFTIRYDGNVGIGVANPLWPLHINNTYNAANSIPILGTGSNQTITPGIKVGDLNIGALYANNGPPVIWSETSLSIQASNGNVSIPRNDLYVGGSISIGGAALSDGNGTTAYNLSMPGGTNQRMGNVLLNTIQTTGNISAGGIFYGNGSGLTDVPYAASAGSAGTATYAVSAGSAPQDHYNPILLYNMSGYQSGGLTFSTDESHYQHYDWWGHADWSFYTPPSYMLPLNFVPAIGIYSDYASFMIFAVAKGSGNVASRGGSYGGISDSNLKENIETARDYIDDICKLRVVKYNFKDDPSYMPYISTYTSTFTIHDTSTNTDFVSTASYTVSTSTHRQIGFIAQEVQKVFNGLVETVYIENPSTLTFTSSLSVKTSVLIPMLVTCVQSLRSTIQLHESTINGHSKLIELLLSTNRLNVQ